MFSTVKYVDGNKEETSQVDRPGTVEATFVNGDTFNGTYIAAGGGARGFVRTGQGCYVWKSGAKYDGQYKNGKRHGFGVYTFPTGEIYEGNWDDGKKSGTGKYTYLNGDVFYGLWSGDKRNGQGRYVFATGLSEIVGEWKNGAIVDSTAREVTKPQKAPPAPSSSPRAAKLEEVVSVSDVSKEIEPETKEKWKNVEANKSDRAEKSDRSEKVESKKKVNDAEVVVEKPKEFEIPKLNVAKEVALEKQKLVDIAVLTNSARPASIRAMKSEKHDAVVENAEPDQSQAKESTKVEVATEGKEEGLEGDKPPLGIIIAGAPASGKGTQCENIRNHFGVVHLSSGDILRDVVKSGSDVGKAAKEYMDKGELVPDDIVIQAIKERLSQDDVKQNGFLLDGFPRSKKQAQELEKMGIKVHICLMLDVAEEDLIERAVGRRVDPETGKIYHLKFFPPPEEDEELLARLVHRIDDTEETVRNRIKIFNEHVGSLKEFYSEVSHEIDGNRRKSMIWNDIKTKIGNLIEIEEALENPEQEDSAAENPKAVIKDEKQVVVPETPEQLKESLKEVAAAAEKKEKESAEAAETNVAPTTEDTDASDTKNDGLEDDGTQEVGDDNNDETPTSNDLMKD